MSRTFRFTGHGGADLAGLAPGEGRPVVASPAFRDALLAFLA